MPGEPSFIGSGAALKRLALMPVATAELSEASAPIGGQPAVDPAGTLRDALDLLVVTGAEAVDVVDAGGRRLGQLTHADISRSLTHVGMVGGGAR